MKMTCKQVEELLPDLAEGRNLPDALLHVDSCPGCAMKLEQFRTMLNAAKVPSANAPAHVLRAAKSLQQGHRKVFTARLFGSSLSLAQSRSTATDFQLMVGSDEHRIRVMYSQLADGKWQVTGRAPSKDWKIARASAPKKLDAEGGFVFSADALTDTDFSLSLGDEELNIPSAQDLLDGDKA